MSLGLYLHIPYCFSKCRYCDFYSAPGQRGVPSAYVDALLRELHRFSPDAPLRPDTLYFGGGTPSLLAPEDAARLIAAASPLPGAEITLEANPETVTEASLCAFREAGINRISFGVQSARDSQLKTLGRPHTARQARAAFAAARRAGFENISGDIMLALPHYTQAEFDETLELIESGGATHISAYLLKIEPDSAFGRHPPEGLPSPDEEADVYLYAVDDDGTESEQTEEHQEETCHQRCDGQSLESILLDDAVDDDDECSCRSANLHFASAEDGDDETRYDGCDDTLLRCHARSDTECDGQRQGYDTNDDTCHEVRHECFLVVTLQARKQTRLNCYCLHLKSFVI